jgi:hypothetical protein
MPAIRQTHHVQTATWIYLARRGDEIKIGISQWPHDRVRQHHATMLCCFEGYAVDERRLHSLVAHENTEGEWFRGDDVEALARTLVEGGDVAFRILCNSVLQPSISWKLPSHRRSIDSAHERRRATVAAQRRERHASLFAIHSAYAHNPFAAA